MGSVNADHSEILTGRSARTTFPSHTRRSWAGMAGWKQSFERGISNFRLNKYEEALACFDDVRPTHPLFDEN